MASKDNEEDNAILLEDLDEDNGGNQRKFPDNANDEMLLLSSSPSSSEEMIDSRMHRPGPSGVVKAQKLINLNSSNIVIEDSDSVESLDNSIEVIGSEDEEDDDELESDSDNSHSSFLDGKVQIFMAQGSFFIWNAEDVQMLREECRIVGKLVGCLPRAPRQNNQLGLPLQLMPEEAKLLEEIEAACVVEEQDPSDDIALLRKTTFEAMREENYRAQEVMYKETRREEVLQLKAEILQGKKAKKRKLQEMIDNSSNSNAESSPTDCKATKSELKDGEGSVKDIKSSQAVKEDEECVTTKLGLQKTDEEKDVENSSGDSVKVKNGDEESEIKKEKKKDEMMEMGDSSGGTVEASEGDKKDGNSPPLADENKKCESKDGDEKKSFSSSPIQGILDSSTDKTDEEVEGKKKEISSSSSNNNSSSSTNVREECEVIDLEGEEEDEEFDVDEIASTETNIKHSLVQLFTENPWRGSVTRPKHWIFPLSQKEFLRFEVFKDLWKKGYYLTSGSKFGGDYLIYPGDPARFHSHFIAVCVDKTVDLSALDIISLGRLGSNVRKTVLLCAFNKLRQIVYTSLQWTGIS